MSGDRRPPMRPPGDSAARNRGGAAPAASAADERGAAWAHTSRARGPGTRGPGPQGPPSRPEGMGIARTMVFGIVVIVVFLGGFGAWAGFAPLERAAIAQGVVSVSGKRKTVQHLEGGIVAGILVKEGGVVTAGQALVVLDDTRARASFSLLQAQHRSAAALEARLQAERDGLDAIRWPAWLRRAVAEAAEEAGGDGDTEDDGEAGEAAGAGEEAGSDVLATQERIFRARARSLDNRIAIHRRQIAQLRAETAGLEEEIEAQNRQLALLEEETAAFRALVERGVEGKPRLLALERTRAEVAGSRARNRSQVARVEQKVGEMRLTIEELGNTRMTEVAAALREVETRLSDLGEGMASARHVLSRTRVLAPVSGTVVNLRVFTRGGVVGPGEALMEIVPAGDRLVVEARVEPTDVDSVRAGLSARVRLTAFSQFTTPALSGEVARVSADRLVDERTGAPYYEARVALDPEQPELAGLKLQPGMPAEVMIVTGERTALEYLLEPIVASFGRALRED